MSREEKENQEWVKHRGRELELGTKIVRDNETMSLIEILTENSS
jgi:hypothetical protein